MSMERKRKLSRRLEDVSARVREVEDALVRLLELKQRLAMGPAPAPAPVQQAPPAKPKPGGRATGRPVPKIKMEGGEAGGGGAEGGTDGGVGGGGGGGGEGGGSEKSGGPQQKLTQPRKPIPRPPQAKAKPPAQPHSPSPSPSPVHPHPPSPSLAQAQGRSALSPVPPPRQAHGTPLVHPKAEPRDESYPGAPETGPNASPVGAGTLGAASVPKGSPLAAAGGSGTVPPAGKAVTPQAEAGAAAAASASASATAGAGAGTAMEAAQEGVLQAQLASPAGTAPAGPSAGGGGNQGGAGGLSQPGTSAREALVAPKKEPGEGADASGGTAKGGGGPGQTPEGPSTVKAEGALAPQGSTATSEGGTTTPQGGAQEVAGEGMQKVFSGVQTARKDGGTVTPQGHSAGEAEQKVTPEGQSGGEAVALEGGNRGGGAQGAAQGGAEGAGPAGAEVKAEGGAVKAEVGGVGAQGGEAGVGEGLLRPAGENQGNVGGVAGTPGAAGPPPAPQVAGAPGAVGLAPVPEVAGTPGAVPLQHSQRPRQQPQPPPPPPPQQQQQQPQQPQPQQSWQETQRELRQLRNEELVQSAFGVLRKLIQHKYAWPFMQRPEGAKEEDGVLDLGTIRDRLSGTVPASGPPYPPYDRAEDVAADVRRVLEGAIAGSERGAEVHRWAGMLLAQFNRAWASQVEPKLVEEAARRQAEDAQAHPRGAGAEASPLSGARHALGIPGSGPDAGPGAPHPGISGTKKRKKEPRRPAKAGGAVVGGTASALGAAGAHAGSALGAGASAAAGGRARGAQDSGESGSEAEGGQGVGTSVGPGLVGVVLGVGGGGQGGGSGTAPAQGSAPTGLTPAERAQAKKGQQVGAQRKQPGGLARGVGPTGGGVGLEAEGGAGAQGGGGGLTEEGWARLAEQVGREEAALSRRVRELLLEVAGMKGEAAALCRPMEVGEMGALAERMTTLPSNSLALVRRLVEAESGPDEGGGLGHPGAHPRHAHGGAPKDDSGKLCINFDALDTSTLWLLHHLVVSCQQPIDFA